MSGGYFDYKQHNLVDIDEKLDELISEIEKEDLEQEQKVIRDIYITKESLSKAYVYLNRLDKLISGDDSEQSYFKRIIEDFEKLNLNNIELRKYI